MRSAISQDDALVAGRKPTRSSAMPSSCSGGASMRSNMTTSRKRQVCCNRRSTWRRNRPMASLALGIVLGRLLRIPEATAALENAIALDPQAFYPHFRMAELHMRVGLVAQAEEELTCAMDLSTSDYERRLVRELRAIDRKRAPRRIWRPDFTGFLGRKPRP